MPVTSKVLQTNKDLTVANDTVVLKRVQKLVLQMAQEPDPDRDEHVLHPSDMSSGDWCWRADYYRLKGAPKDTKGVTAPSFHMENVYLEGHEIHRRWQGWLWRIGVLYGVFRCKYCESEWWDRSPSECFYCERRGFLQYREVPLRAPELTLAGRADGGLMIEGEPFRLLEVKSVSLGTLRFDAPEFYDRYLNNEPLDKIWMDINRPFPKHVRQGALYLYMATRGAANPDVPVPSEMRFIYEWKVAQKVKEFKVVYNPRLVERMLGGAQAVTDSMEQGKPPQRPSWASDENAKVCTSCPYRSVCWKLDHEQRNEDPPQAIPIKRAPLSVRRSAAARKASEGAA